MTNLYLQSLSFVYMIIIAFLFFSKKRVESVETKIFSVMTLVNIFGLVLDILIVYLSYTRPFEEPLYIFNKIYLLYVLAWVMLFNIYIAYISLNKNRKIYLNIKKIIYVMGAISTALIFILPIYLYNENNIMYTHGPSVNVLYAVGVINLVMIFIVFLSNYKNAIDKKYTPIYALLLAAFANVVIRTINPGLLLTTTIITIINVIMYHTIENPDIKLLEKIELSKAMAEKANRAKSEFLSSMSHEIRTPLNAIVGFSEAIIEEETFEAAKEDASDIIKASRSLLEIVNGILNISKIEAGKMELVDSEYKPSEIFDEVYKNIKIRFDDKKLDFTYHIAEDLPKWLRGDRGKILEITQNLLTNAFKYTEDGFVKLNVDCINQNGYSKLIISVEDSGRGIKQEKIDKLFTKFNRLDEDKNTTLEGTGLGLSITKSFANMMGGDVDVTSVYGKGAKFTATIVQKIIDKDIDDTIVIIDVNAKLPDLSNKRILVVDDNQMNLKVAAKFLEKYKINIETAINGSECILKTDNNEYDLILMDDMMPGASGTDVMTELKGKGYSKPIVVLTANAVEGEKDKYIEIGFDGYLAKPIIKDEFNKVVEKFLNK